MELDERMIPSYSRVKPNMPAAQCAARNSGPVVPRATRRPIPAEQMCKRTGLFCFTVRAKCKDLDWSSPQPYCRYFGEDLTIDKAVKFGRPKRCRDCKREGAPRKEP